MKFLILWQDRVSECVSDIKFLTAHQHQKGHTVPKRV